MDEDRTMTIYEAIEWQHSLRIMWAQLEQLLNN